MMGKRISKNFVKERVRDGKAIDNNELKEGCPKKEKECANCKELHCPDEITFEDVNWLNILHFYQPPFQDVDVAQKITEECYLPVSRLLLERPDAKAVINTSGCLLEILNEQITEGKEIIDNLKTMLSRGQIEITGTGKYHPIFPLISEKEVERQLTLQEESLNDYLNIEKTPDILYLPELAYLPEQTKLFKEKGYQWLVIDEISLKKKKSKTVGCQLKEKKSGINLLARNRDISEALANSIWRTYDIDNSQEFVEHAVEDSIGNGTIVTALNVEVFGHRQADRWKLLAEIYDNPSVKSVSVRQASAQYSLAEVVETIPGSCVANSQDVSNRIYYPLWHYPQNRLHQLLWQLLDLTLDEVRSHGSSSNNKALDKLLNSDTFASSSYTPWWDGIVAEKTSDSIVNLLEKTEGLSNKITWVAQSIRRKIYDEVSILTKTGIIKELQKNFLKEHGISKNTINYYVS